MHVNLSFYTDGAYSSASKRGGWSCLAVELTEEGKENLLSVETGKEDMTTNNRMELRGFICALETIKNLNTYSDALLTIYTDSAYIANCINEKWYENWRKNGWRTSDKRPVKNQDLWGTIVSLYIRLSNTYSNLKIIKVKAHQDNKWNAAADLYAVKARTEVKN
jgi:ribonuclease HI